jgi:hypothetical protein
MPGAIASPIDRGAKVLQTSDQDLARKIGVVLIPVAHVAPTATAILVVPAQVATAILVAPAQVVTATPAAPTVTEAHVLTVTAEIREAHDPVVRGVIAIPAVPVPAEIVAHVAPTATAIPAVPAQVVTVIPAVPTAIVTHDLVAVTAEIREAHDLVVRGATAIIVAPAQVATVIPAAPTVTETHDHAAVTAETPEAHDPVVHGATAIIVAPAQAATVTREARVLTVTVTLDLAAVTAILAALAQVATVIPAAPTVTETHDHAAEIGTPAVHVPTATAIRELGVTAAAAVVVLAVTVIRAAQRDKVDSIGAIAPPAQNGQDVQVIVPNRAQRHRRIVRG